MRAPRPPDQALHPRTRGQRRAASPKPRRLAAASCSQCACLQLQKTRFSTRTRSDETLYITSVAPVHESYYPAPPHELPCARAHVAKAWGLVAGRYAWRAVP